MDRLPGYQDLQSNVDDLYRRLLSRQTTKERLEGVPAKERLEGLTPEERIELVMAQLAELMPQEAEALRERLGAPGRAAGPPEQGRAKGLRQAALRATAVRRGRRVPGAEPYAGRRSPGARRAIWLLRYSSASATRVSWNSPWCAATSR